MGDVIGEGVFGVVRKAMLKISSSNVIVAVKMLKGIFCVFVYLNMCFWRSIEYRIYWCDIEGGIL